MLMITPCHHVRQHGLARAVDRPEVQRHGQLVGPLVQVDRPAHVRDADVVVQHVDGARPFERGGHGLRHRGQVRHVGAQGDGLVALRRDDARCRLRGLLVDVDAGDARPRPRVGHRGRLAVAPAVPLEARAEHDDALALQLLAHA